MKRVAASITFILTVLAVTGAHAEPDAIDVIMARTTGNSGIQSIQKSGTPDLLRILQSDTADGRAMKTAITEAARPELDTYYDSLSGRFRVHFDLSGTNAPDLSDTDFNGVPDYIDSTAVYLDYSWALMVDELGYAPPVGDGLRGGEPSGMIDCYIKHLQSGSSYFYGLTKPDNGHGKTSSWLEIENDFSESAFSTKGYEALKITTAHEFFHVIHFSYFGTAASIWWMEQSAVWMEDRAWDDVNDYLYYLDPLFRYRNKSINLSDNSNFFYSACLFAFVIAETYGDNMIRSTWNKIRDTQSGDIKIFNTVLPEGLPQALSDLAVWMYFTGYRSNNEFFKDSDIINDMVMPEQIKRTTSAVDSLSLQKYTFNYVEIEPEEGLSAGDSLKVNFIDRDGGNWKKQVIFYNSPDNYLVQPLNGMQPVLHIERPFLKAVIVVANASPVNRHYDLVYSYDIIDTISVEKEPEPSPFAIHKAYPNPFNAATTIPFTLDAEGQARLTVHNLQGAVVAELIDTVLPAGTHSAAFDASGMASGIYFASLISNGRRETAKLLYLK